MFGVGLMPGDRLDIPRTANFLEMPCGTRDDINTSAVARRQPRQVARQCRAARRPVLPSSRLQAQLRSGAWPISMIRACHRLVCYSSPIYSSSIPGRGSRGTVTAVGGGQENTRL
jgi:hypothetical protein